MAYLGNTPTTQGFIPAVDFFSGNGATVAFTLSRPVASVAQVQATIENVPQNPGTAFTVSGNTITFDGAPASGTNNIYVYYTSPITQVIAPSQGTVFPSTLSTGGPYWDTSSNVGIGTTSPTSKLQVQSAGTNYITSRNSVAGGLAGLICQNGSDTRGIRINDANLELYDFSAGVSRLTINASGQTTMPYQPTFTARKSNGTNSTSAGVIVFNAVSTNTGSHYNNTNGRFTAPITGRYLFVFTGASQVTSDFGLLINGTQTGYQGYASGSNTTSTATAIFNLNANDYVQVESLSNYRGDNHTMWCGCLLG
jgi:hypothetical protein